MRSLQNYQICWGKAILIRAAEIFHKIHVCKKSVYSGYIFTIKKIYCEKDKKEGTGVYRRITTYIYSYDNGQKICSCGYCRFDVHDNQCKIFINVKVPDRYTMGIAEIYLLTQDEATKDITREMLGRTGGINGNICYRQICSRQHMAGNIGMDNIKGVLIYNGESLKKAFYCNLKGDEPDILSLEKQEKALSLNDDEDTEYFSDDTYEYDSNEYIHGEKADENNMTADGNITDGNNITVEGNITDGNNMTVEGNITNGNNMSSESNTTDGNNVTSDSNVTNSNNTTGSKQTDENDCQNNNASDEEKQIEYSDIVDWEHNGADGKGTVQKDKWQELLFSKFPKVRIIFGGEESEAIKMRPHDLVWFPRKYWRFSNNRCLLNGYYNYRYIMLVKGIGDREGNYYLAVPGKNMVNEAISARKHGFSEFVRSKGDLGFWCCKVVQ